MKIRNRHLLRAAGWLAARMTRGLVRTLRVEHRSLGPIAAPVSAIPPGPRYVYSLWHENLLFPAAYFGHPDLAVLISRHADGQLLGSLINSMGMRMVLGSTNRGGVEAVRQIVQGTAVPRHLVVTPDGPRGPRRVVQPGVVYVASRTGMAVVPVGIGYHRPWRARSWDRFAVPRPGSRVRMILGEPITIPARLRTAEMEPYQALIQQVMNQLSEAAEEWAETNRLNLPAPPASAPLTS